MRTKNGSRMHNVNRPGDHNAISLGTETVTRGQSASLKGLGWGQTLQADEKILNWGQIEKGRKRVYSKQVLSRYEEMSQPSSSHFRWKKLPGQRRGLFQMQP